MGIDVEEKAVTDGGKLRKFLG